MLPRLGMSADHLHPFLILLNEICAIPRLAPWMLLLSLSVATCHIIGDLLCRDICLSEVNRYILDLRFVRKAFLSLLSAATCCCMITTLVWNVNSLLSAILVKFLCALDNAWQLLGTTLHHLRLCALHLVPWSTYFGLANTLFILKMLLLFSNIPLYFATAWVISW